MNTRKLAAALIAIGAAFACSQQPTSVPPPPGTPPPPPGVPQPPPPPGQQPPPAPPPPPPGQPGGSGRLTASLTSPNSSDGAILLELRGNSIHGVTLANSSWKMFADSSGSPIRIAIMGSITSGALLTFEVPDVGAASSYTATIVDVADGANKLRGNSGYSLTIAR